MSKNNIMKKKFDLFYKSKNFCSVPWNHIKVDTDGSIYTCVNGSVLLGNIHNENIEKILQSPKLKEIRDALFLDQCHINCTKNCNKLEIYKDDKKIYKFLRYHYNPIFLKSEIDYSKNENFKLSGIDLHWSSICDLKCMMCWHGQSSSIAKEENKPILHTTTEAADRLIDFIIKNQDNLKEIYMSGGEPTLIKHNLKLLKRLEKDKNFVIRFNTNMMFNPNNQIINELKKFPNVLITISVDGMDEKFNYIRKNGNWKLLVKNLENLKNTNFKFRVNSVFFIPTAFCFLQTIQFFIDNFNIQDFTINQLSMDKNSKLLCRNLLFEQKIRLEKQIIDFQNKHNNNKNLFHQLSNCIDELREEKTEEFIDFFEHYDNKNKTNWKEIFKEFL